MTSTAVSVVVTTGVPLDDVLAEVIEGHNASWSVDELRELARLIPEHCRRRVLAMTVVSVLRAYVLRAVDRNEAWRARTELATVLRDQGRYEQAETECRAVLAAQTAVLGAEHPDTLTTRHNLATMLHE
jgi:hypothetical protein